MNSPNPSIRQGLPRVAGGAPWPPAELFGGSGPAAAPAPAPAPAPDAPAPAEIAKAEAVPAQTPASTPAKETAQHATGFAGTGALRQGLPRVPGGEPWPPAGSPMATPAAGKPAAQPVAESAVDPVPEPASEPPAVAQPAAMPAAPVATGAVAVRRGLPRAPGGEPWPPSSFTATPIAAAKPAATGEPEAVSAQPEPAAQKAEAAAPAPAAKPAEAPAVQSATAGETAKPAATPPTPAPAPRTRMAPQKQAAAPSSAPAAKPAAEAKKEPAKHGPLTTKQWILAGILGAFCALGVATAVVLVARGIAGIGGVASFIERYPGEYHLPDSAPVGIPGWLAWNHFFNFFLMVLIIRSGMLVRHQKKPPAYWSSKRSPKVSINLWLHQGLDLLWIINGLVFVVLLFATGHWMRVIPTSWEVFPNALSAAVQYLTLDWPTENGWVNYNSLQQLAYFATIFIAAPLAAITGFRLSAYWPKNAAGLNKKYPIEAARALHFPTMLYFVLFIVVHVVLVFSTGALRNLNHMYAAQGSTDPTAYAGNWVGLLFFALSLLVTAGAWVACRPMILASIARLFGKVSAR